MNTVIHWYTSLEIDRATFSFIQSAIKSNRVMGHAELQVHEPDDVDADGTITITGNRLDRLIDPGEVHRLIDMALS